MTSERAEYILDYGTGSRSTLVNLLRPQGLFYIVNQYLNTMDRTINQSKPTLTYGLKAFKSSSFASITGDFSYQNSSLKLNTSRSCKNKLEEHNNARLKENRTKAILPNHRPELDFAAKTTRRKFVRLAKMSSTDSTAKGINILVFKQNSLAVNTLH